MRGCASTNLLVSYVYLFGQFNVVIFRIITSFVVRIMNKPFLQSIRNWTPASRTKNQIFFIAGPCVVESRELALNTAGVISEIAAKFNVEIIYKSSFDKANRTSVRSFRGLGIDEGLRILSEVREKIRMPVLTDVHETWQIREAAQVVDVLQTPAFLARQTDFIIQVACSGKPVNFKKAQFMAPLDMEQVLSKAKFAAREQGISEDQFMVCERGTMFGYNNLVVDMRSLAVLRANKVPVVFDATHSVQTPGSFGYMSGGQREFVPVLARAAVAVGIDGLFFETHPNPEKAKSDGQNSLPLGRLAELVETVIEIDWAARKSGRMEDDLGSGM